MQRHFLTKALGTPIRTILSTASILLLSTITLSVPTNATWRPEYAAAPQTVQDWYRNAELTKEAQSRFHFTKCCDKSEVVHSQFRVNKTDAADEWFYEVSPSVWKRVPPDIIHWGKSAPNGLPTLFVLPSGSETCFFPGTSGI